MNSLAAHMTPTCGCATSIRKMLNPPTITFSTQKSSRVANTVQPKNSTPASGMRFAATSTRALGVSRRAGRSAMREVKVALRCRVEAVPPRACRLRAGGGSWRRERSAPEVGRRGNLRQPVRDVQVARASRARPRAARGPGSDYPIGGLGGAPGRRATGPGNERQGNGGARGGDRGTDYRRGDPGVPGDLQRVAEGILRSAAAGQPDREDRRADRDGAWGGPLTFGRPRDAAPVREPRGHGDCVRGVRDHPTVHRRQARPRTARSRGPGGSRSAGPRGGTLANGTAASYK